MLPRPVPLLLATLLLACGPDVVGVPPPVVAPPPATVTPPAPTASADEGRPPLRLPADVHPVSEAIELTVRPDQARFSGKVDIDVQLDQPRQSLWLHARKLHVSSATVAPDASAPIAATWSDEDEHGLGRLHLPTALPAGHAKIHIEYDAAFVAGNKGLFKATEAGVPYAFTQFEATDARRAFPCFDEPGYKIPFSVTLDVPDGQQAITNTLEVGRTPGEPGLVRVRFGTTKPLPSYLVAFAVGPLDVVKAPDVPSSAVRPHPLPLRGVAVKGRGPELAYALAHAGEILSLLEGYFGIEYPYEKMDILAVPDMSGAMENAGAVTFNEPLILLDPKTAPISQRLDFAEVVAHEFSHQWFGDLVTMAWWDDTWLNESFAEWMGFKIAAEWDPSLHADMGFVGGTQGAISIDSLVTARQIHQPITGDDDIENAFDDTTYQKGGSVIAMFERWLGPEVFRKGVQLHLSEHRYASATVDDFLRALSSAAGRDVATPYRTFLDQPGVPFIEASLQCGGADPSMHLKQSRFLPRGSTGDAHKLWQVPVCVKYPDRQTQKETCTLLTSAEGDVPLETATCPAWVFPNAHGTGYYRFALASADLAKLRATGVKALDTHEKIAFGNSLRAAFNHGTTPFGEVVLAATPLFGDPEWRVAGELAGYVDVARDWLIADPARPRVEAYARKAGGAAFARLGWTKKKGDSSTTVELRRAMLEFLVSTGRDPAARAEARRRAEAYVGYRRDGALHRDAVDENLAGVALWVAGQEADASFFDAVLALLVKTQDDVVRGRLLGALAAASDPKLSARARDLVLDEHVKYTEMLTPLWVQLGTPETRDVAWAWLKEHWDAVAARAANVLFEGVQLLSIPVSFCDEAHERDVATFLKDRAAKIDGGPRVLSKTVEEIHLCAVKRRAEEDNARVFFTKR